MRRARKKKDIDRPKAPPTIVSTLRIIAKLGRRKNIDDPTTPIEINMQGLVTEDEGAIALIKAMKENHVHCSLLNLSMCGLTDLSAIKIALWLTNDKYCKTLCLQGNHIEDNGGAAIAKALQSNTSLTSLRIENNRLHVVAGNAFAKTLQTNSTAFRELNLLANPFGSIGISSIFLSLASNRPRVVSVHLRRCDIDCEAIIILADALRTNETITSLDLSANLIADEGAVGK